MSASNARCNDLFFDSDLSGTQQEEIVAQLDLVAIALFALTQISPDGLMDAARELKLDLLVTPWVNGWRSRQPQQLNLDQIKALVITIGHLAQQHQTLTRRNIIYWEQMLQYGRSVHESPSLADYINNFIKIYQDRTDNVLNLSPAVLSESALNILIELLLYSSPNGHQRLWGALLQRAGTRES